MFVNASRNSLSNRFKSEDFPTNSFFNSQSELLKKIIFSKDKFENHYVCENLQQSPKFSIVVPIYRPNIPLLVEALDSVRKQECRNFEIVLCIDGPHDSELTSTLNDLRSLYKGIKLIQNTIQGGISSATNACIEKSVGQYIVFLDQDDLLLPTALSVICDYTRHSSPSIIYTDHNVIDQFGNELDRFIKPDYSPILLLQFMYMGHLKVIKRELFNEFGMFDSRFDGSQDFEWFTRFIGRLDRKEIVHVSQILYSWRRWSNSTTNSDLGAPTYTLNLTVKATENALARLGISAVTYLPEFAASTKQGVSAFSFQDQCQDITIVIPSINKELINSCLLSMSRIFLKQAKVLIIDNTAEGNLEVESSIEIENLKKVHIPNDGYGFSFARIMNKAAKFVDTDVILFLNDDTRVINPNSLSEMRGTLDLPGCGIVGGKLIFPNNLVQTNGIRVPGGIDLSIPIFRNMGKDDLGYMNFNQVIRETSAVTGACLMIRTKDFEEVGGFNEYKYAVAYNDVDLCLRVSKELQLSTVVNSYALFIHAEGSSREKYDNPAEERAFMLDYRKYTDPYYQSHFLIEDQGCYKLDSNSYFSHFSLTKPNSVLMGSHNLNLEGAPRSLFVIAKSLQRRGFHVEVISLKDGPLRTEYEKLGINVSIYTDVGSWDRIKFDAEINLLSQNLRISNFDVVICNTSQLFPLALASIYAELPSIWFIRETESAEDQFPLAPSWYKDLWYETQNRVDSLIFVSRTTKNFFLNIQGISNYKVIPNMVNGKTDFKVPEGSQLVLLSIGTFCERKNQLLLLKALSLIPKNYWKDVRLIMVGDIKDSYSEAVSLEAKKLFSQGLNISIFSHTDQIEDFYKKANIVLLTSNSESYPRVILEAFQCGIPVLASNVGGIKELIHHDFNGLLFEKNDYRSLSEAIIKCFDEKYREYLQVNVRTSLQRLITEDEGMDQISLTLNQVYSKHLLKRRRDY